MKRTPFKDLTADLPSERRRDVELMKQELRSDMSLAELRSARRLAREAMAATLDDQQPSVAELEKRMDMYVSKLRGFIEAAGGTLEIRTCFPDGEVEITKFAEINEAEEAEADDRSARPIISRVAKAIARGRASS